MAPIFHHLDRHTHPLHPPLQSCSWEEIYCRPRLLWANTNKMLFCCNLFNWPQKRRLEHVQALPAPMRLPGSHMLSAPCSWPPLAVTTEDGTLGKRGIKGEERPKEAAGLEKAGRSPPPSALLFFFFFLSPAGPSALLTPLPQPPKILISQAA